jgi:hypothetical protein
LRQFSTAVECMPSVPLSVCSKTTTRTSTAADADAVKAATSAVVSGKRVMVFFFLSVAAKVQHDEHPQVLAALNSCYRQTQTF